jgi:hypothetical protein
MADKDVGGGKDEIVEQVAKANPKDNPEFVPGGGRVAGDRVLSGLGVMFRKQYGTAVDGAGGAGGGRAGGGGGAGGAVNAQWRIVPTGRDALYNHTFRAEKIREGYVPPAPAREEDGFRQMTEAEMIIDADARRQAQLAQFQRNQKARDTEAAAVAALERARRVKTTKAWEFYKEKIEEAKVAKANINRR